MALIEDSCLRGCKGKVGGLVVYRLGDRTVVRTVGERESGEFSAGQRAQQERIASVAILYKSMKAAGLHKGWQEAVRGTALTGYNEFVRRNVSAFSGDGRIADFGKLQLTAGRLLLPDKLEVCRSGEDEVEIRWSNERLYPGMRGDDRIMAAMMKRKDVFTIKILNAEENSRERGRVRIRLPPELECFPHLFVYACSATGEEFSVSRYFYSFKI